MHEISAFVADGSAVTLVITGGVVSMTNVADAVVLGDKLSLNAFAAPAGVRPLAAAPFLKFWNVGQKVFRANL